MAKINKKILSFFLRWEGGLSRDKNDTASSYPCPMMFKGHDDWHTNKGITYKTWEAFRGKKSKTAFLNMKDEDVEAIFKEGYWDKVKADKINSEAVAVCLVSWAWGSGAKTAIKQIQRVLDVPRDGIIGKITLGAINDEDETELFDRMIKARRSFFYFITKKENARRQQDKLRYQKNAKFLNGWLNRLEDFNKKFRPTK